MLGSFYISHEGGNCHSFIASLILHLLTDDPSVIKFSTRGHSHDYINKFPRSVPSQPNTEPAPTYYVVNPLGPCIEYKNIDILGDFLKTNPNNKIIVIVVDKKDELRVEYNHFYKAYFGLPEQVIYYWDFYQKHNISGIRKNLTKFTDFTNEEIKLLLEYVSIEKNRNRSMELRYWKIEKFKFPNNIFILPFSDIISYQESTLETIGKIVGKPVPEVLHQSYKNYVQLQTEFEKKYMFYIPK